MRIHPSIHPAQYFLDKFEQNANLNEIVTTTCMTRIDVVPPLRHDSASWFDIWAAGEAINAICVLDRKEGLAYGIGTSALPSPSKVTGKYARSSTPLRNVY